MAGSVLSSSASAPGDGVAAGVDRQLRLPPEERLEQVEGEPGHDPLEFCATFLVGRAGRIR